LLAFVPWLNNDREEFFLNKPDAYSLTPPPIVQSKNMRNHFTQSLQLSLIFACWLGVASFNTCSAQVFLKANPLDPFPANAEALNDKAKSNTELSAALESFRTGNVTKLKLDLEAYKKSDASLPHPDVMLARLLMANGQWPDALATLETYLTTVPTDAEAHKCFAEIAMISGRWTDAWLQLEKAYGLVDGMSFTDKRKRDFLIELVRLRGEVAEQRKDYPVAKKLFETLKKLQPNDGAPDWALGRLKVSEGDIDGGFELLKQGRKIDSTLPQPELAIALDLMRRGDVEKAEAWFVAGTKNKESSGVANWFQYLQFLIELDRAEDAEKLFADIPQEFLSQRDFRLANAVIQRHLKKLPEAERILSELHQSNPSDLDAGDHLALVLIESEDEGKRARAEQIAEANLRQSPNNERIAATVAWVKYRTGSTDVADNILGQLVHAGRISSQTAYYTAQVLKSLGKPAEAKQFLQIAATAPGSFPQKRDAITEWKSAP
jgi:tetratricopeptide (TPR) repeat protein